MMDNDDQQVGQILSRREVLKLLGMAGAATLVGCAPTQTATTQPTSAPVAPAPTAAATAAVAATAAAASATAPEATVATVATSVATPVCVVKPEVTEGPYYVDEQLVRSDIRADPATGVVKDGALLRLTFRVSQVGSSCTPLQGATVDVWHCDATGVYSDVADRSFNTVGQKFLRGSQVTDANGIATFTTIYPGWYQGRTVHIHFKVQPTTSTVFTSQLFFADTFTDQVFTQAPYASNGTRNTLNSNDNIYNKQLLLDVNTTDQGYAATFDIGVNAA